MPTNMLKARELFLHAVGKLPPEEWDRFAAEACGGDAELERQLGEMFRLHREAGSFLERPAVAWATVAAPPPADGTALHGTESDDVPGAVIGPYKLLQQLGEGGMGTVFMAEQTRPVQRKVALKLIKAGMDTKSVLARFEVERQALALMDHPNIARVLDVGTTDRGLPYFVMELVKGVPITQYCDERRLTCEERLTLFVQVCQAVQHAHQKGVIHRDIKPSNVLVCLYDGKPVPKVIDFGVAKATGQKLTDRTLFTEVGAVVGTLQYMSPEQAEVNQLDVDTRSDIYSLGVLLYELLTGTTPLERKRCAASLLEVLRVIREEETPRPSTRLSTTDELPSIAANRGLEPRRLSGLVRGELDWIALKALEKDRARRYETANAFAADVQRYLDDEPVQACPPSAWYRFRKFARRNRPALVAATAAALAVAAAVAGLATSNFLIAREKAETAKALHEANEARDDLKRTNERERVEAYHRRIAMAYSALSVNNLGDAIRLLNGCPNDLRGWEWRYLMRLCKVEPLVIRDKDKVGFHSVAFSSDGERLASAGGDGAVKVWNSRTGKLITERQDAHRGFASSVAFHPLGNHLLSVGADRSARVWDLTATPPRQVFECPCDAVHIFGTAYAGAFSPHNPDQIAVGWEGAVTLWNWRTKKSVRQFPGHGPHRISLTYSRDGRRLASGSWGGSVRLLDAEGGSKPLGAFSDKRHVVAALAFSPDAARLALATFGRRVELWETTTGTPIHTLPQSGLVLGVAFSPDGRLVASAGEDKTVHVWDAASGRELLGLRGHKGMCSCVTFSPDGFRLASASADGTIRVWDATRLQGDERQESGPDFEEHGVEVWSLAVSPDGTKVASAALGPPVMIWDPRTRQVSARFSDHDRVAFCTAWHPDGRRVAFAGANGDQFTVRVRSLDARNEPEPFPLTAASEYFAVAFSPDGQYLVTGNGARLVEVWDAQTNQRVNVLGSHKGVLRGVAFSPDPDHKYLASMSSDGEVKLWDAKRIGEKGKPQQPLRTFAAHSPGVGLSMAFSPDGKRLVTGGLDYTAKIWDVETRKELLVLRGHTGDVYTVAFSPDGRRVATAGEDSTVKVWDSRTGDLLRDFRGHTGLVSTMAFLDDRTLITGSRDHTIKFWNLTHLEGGPDQ